MLISTYTEVVLFARIVTYFKGKPFSVTVVQWIVIVSKNSR